jgi:hypothetical protein
MGDSMREFRETREVPSLPSGSEQGPVLDPDKRGEVKYPSVVSNSLSDG